MVANIYDEAPIIKIDMLSIHTIIIYSSIYLQREVPYATYKPPNVYVYVCVCMYVCMCVYVWIVTS